MKKYILMILVFLPIILVAETLYVDINGGQEYYTINHAVNNAVNGDTIIVYPGTYTGPVSFSGKSLTIGSLEMTTGNQDYISQTIIDGANQWISISIVNVDAGKLQGFTIKNGFWNSSNSSNGAGIDMFNARNFELKNCKLFDNVAVDGTGGLKISTSENITLSGLSVHDNRGLATGGVSFFNCSNIIFDDENKCSIYNNMGNVGVDLYTYMHNDELKVILDTITVADPSIFFVREADEENYTFDLEYDNVFMEEVDQDLYVAPNGDDDNDGLTAATPMQTIQKAVYRIKPNSENPNTIHLASGNYSHEQNNQIFPISIKNFTNIIGEGEVNIYLDEEDYGAITLGSRKKACLKNINIFPRTSIQYFFGVPNSKNNRIQNVTVNSNKNAIADYNIRGNTMENLVLKNVTVQNVKLKETSIAKLGFMTGRFENCKFINNTDTYETLGWLNSPLSILIKDNQIDGEPAFVMENCLMQGNRAYRDIFSIGELYASEGLHRDEIIFNNNIFIDNYSTSDEHNFIFALLFGPDPAYINNCLFVNNGTAEEAIFLAGNVTINNSIFANNTLQNKEFRLNDTSDENTIPYPYPTNVVLNNCAIKGGEDSYVDLDPENNTIEFNNTIDLNEYDLSDIFTYEDSTDYMSYQLADHSPLIDTGFQEEGYYLPQTDFLGKARIWQNQIDIGPFEYGSVGTDEPEEVPPLEVAEIRNYPNPFRPGNGRNNTGTTIAFNTPEFGRVSVDVYNIKGQLVRNLKSASMMKGEHKIWWNGFNKNNYHVTSGVYFCKVELDGKVLGIRKMILIK